MNYHPIENTVQMSTPEEQTRVILKAHEQDLLSVVRKNS